MILPATLSGASSGTVTVLQPVSSSPDNKQILIDGNLIDAEKAYKENLKKDADNAGIIPRSFELCKMASDGSVSVIRRGVIAYAISGDKIYYSNGRHVLLADGDKTERIVFADHVTYITVC